MSRRRELIFFRTTTAATANLSENDHIQPVSVVMWNDAKSEIRHLFCSRSPIDDLMREPERDADALVGPCRVRLIVPGSVGSIYPFVVFEKPGEPPVFRFHMAIPGTKISAPSMAEKEWRQIVMVLSRESESGSDLHLNPYIHEEIDPNTLASRADEAHRISKSEDDASSSKHYRDLSRKIEFSLRECFSTYPGNTDYERWRKAYNDRVSFPSLSTSSALGPLPPSEFRKMGRDPNTYEITKVAKSPTTKRTKMAL